MPFCSTQVPVSYLCAWFVFPPGKNLQPSLWFDWPTLVHDQQAVSRRIPRCVRAAVLLHPPLGNEQAAERRQVLRAPVNDRCSAVASHVRHSLEPGRNYVFVSHLYQDFVPGAEPWMRSNGSCTVHMVFSHATQTRLHAGVLLLLLLLLCICSARGGVALCFRGVCLHPHMQCAVCLCVRVCLECVRVLFGVCAGVCRCIHSQPVSYCSASCPRS